VRWNLNRMAYCAEAEPTITKKINPAKKINAAISTR
jgi:hypothetical protein